jgi:pimeloyl-ACP methyl ester carboxylesterase
MSTAAETFFREAGAGPGVVCLHSNASSSSQWRALIDKLEPRHHMLAPDGYGAGKGPPWPAGRGVSLHDEAALVAPVRARAGAPHALVGHSHGGAVALVAALQSPQAVSALVLYEPTLFALVDAERAPPNDADGIRAAVNRAEAALQAGDHSAAAGHFIDYWMGAGAWAATPAARRGPIEAAIVNVRGWADALTREPTPLAAFAALTMPVLLLCGSESPASALAVVRVLATVLPQVEVRQLEGLGHMGPITHAERVNDQIAAFLERHRPG